MTQATGTEYDFDTPQGWQQWARDLIARSPELAVSLAPLSGTLAADPEAPVAVLGGQEQEQQMATNDSETLAETATVPEAVEGEQFRTFTDCPVGIIGEPSSDRRILVNGIELAFREFPHPLQWCKQNSGGHMDSYTVGVVESMARHDNQVLATGYLLNTPEADEAENLLHHRVSSPSLDIADSEWHYAGEDGDKIDSEDLMGYLESGKPLYKAFTKGEVIGTTLVALPAFGAIHLTLNEARESRDAALVASAAEEFRPRIYNHQLFEDPKLSGPTMSTMDEDGRIYGHLAVFGQCHRGYRMQSADDCVMVPRSPTGYEQFHTSPGLRLDDGSRLPVGRLTVGTGHADPRLRPAPAAAHYDNTGSCFALVRVGEDPYGIWFSGVAAPGASAEVIEQGLGAPLSGDWRNFGQGLDLMAVLAVNAPGFAVQGVDDHEGRPAALVASVGPSPSMSARVTRHDIHNWISAAFEEFTESFARKFPGLSPAPVVDDSTAVAKEVVHSEESEQANDLLAVDDKSPNEQIQELLAQAGI